MHAPISQLYQNIILTHNRTPQNYGILSPHTHHARCLNTQCGDELDISLYIDNKVFQNIAFQADACAITMASASLLTSHIKQKSLRHFYCTQDNFQHLLKADLDEAAHLDLGELAIFQTLQAFPARHSCALLPFQAITKALSQNSD